jgi:hypothetical protein
LIVGHNTIIPKNVTERIAPTIEKLRLQGLVSLRMLEKVGVAVYIADNKQAALMFSGGKGEVDRAFYFLATIPYFVSGALTYLIIFGTTQSHLMQGSSRL